MLFILLKKTREEKINAQKAITIQTLIKQWQFSLKIFFIESDFEVNLFKIFFAYVGKIIFKYYFFWLLVCLNFDRHDNTITELVLNSMYF